MGVYLDFRKLRKIHFPIFFSLMPDSGILFSMVEKKEMKEWFKVFFLNVDIHKSKPLFIILRPTSLHCHLHSNPRKGFLSKKPWETHRNNLLLAFALSFSSRFSNSLMTWTLLSVLTYHVPLFQPQQLVIGLSSPP